MNSIKLKSLIFITLLFVQFYHLCAQTSSELRIVEEVRYLTDQIIDNEIRDNNGSVCAGLMIISDIPGLTYDSNNGIVKANHKEGEDFLFVSPTERVVKIYGPGFVPLQIILNDIGINLKSGQVWQIKITGDKKLDLIPVNIITDPKDVQLTIDGRNYNASSAIQVSEGKHEIILKKDGYQTHSTSINVSALENLFNYKLVEKVQSVITIKSIPTNANIYLNDFFEGKTDKNIWKYPGKYQLRVSKSGYITTNQVINVSEDSKNEFLIGLVKNSGTLIVKTMPINTNVLVDKNLQDSKNIELPSGSHSIEITHDNYKSIKEVITIKRNEILTKEYSLQPIFGSLQFSSIPRDAICKLFVAGIEIKSWSGENILNELIIGKYELQVSKAGFESQTENININENEKRIVEVYLEKSKELDNGEVVLSKSNYDREQDINNWRIGILGGIMFCFPQGEIINSGYLSANTVGYQTIIELGTPKSKLLFALHLNTVDFGNLKDDDEREIDGLGFMISTVGVTIKYFVFDNIYLSTRFGLSDYKFEDETFLKNSSAANNGLNYGIGFGYRFLSADYPLFFDLSSKYLVHNNIQNQINLLFGAGLRIDL